MSFFSNFFSNIKKEKNKQLKNDSILKKNYFKKTSVLTVLFKILYFFKNFEFNFSDNKSKNLNIFLLNTIIF